MLLTLDDKLQIYFGNTNFLLGLLFSAIGLVMMVNFLPAVDFESVWFISQPTTQVQGIITSASPTDYSDSEAEDRVWEINYTFRLDGRLHKSYSYSSTQNVRPGTSIQVEYVRARPELSRILGTSNAPFPLWALLPVIGAAISGLLWIRKSVAYSKQAIAIADDPFITSAICTQIKTKSSNSDEEKSYNAYYTYRFVTLIGSAALNTSIFMKPRTPN